jgi:hypothetical protein
MTDATLRLKDSLVLLSTIAMTLAPLVPYALDSMTL